MTATPPSRRFLQPAEVAEVLNTSSAQVYALLRSGELPGIKLGGRGQWRVEVSELEKFIERMYAETRDFVNRTQPTQEPETPEEPGSTPDEDSERAEDRQGVDDRSGA